MTIGIEENPGEEGFLRTPGEGTRDPGFDTLGDSRP